MTWYLACASSFEAFLLAFVVLDCAGLMFFPARSACCYVPLGLFWPVVLAAVLIFGIWAHRSAEIREELEVFDVMVKINGYGRRKELFTGRVREWQ